VKEIMIWFGADPGGAKKFGIALLRDDGSFKTKCVDCADEAAAWLSDRPSGIGIDCPLWWSSGRSSDRKADKWLRRRGIHSGTVQAANSLKGAILVQGMMLAFRLRKKYGRVPITEAHPKALLRFFGLHGRSWKKVTAHFEIVGSEPPSLHERDAVLAAVAARNGVTGVWTRDLSRDRGDSELDPKEMWFGEVRYFWPESAETKPNQKAPA
jgi:predicted nuclease with RNAse H fold